MESPSLAIPLAQLVTRLVCPPKFVHHQSSHTHEQRAVQRFAALQSAFRSKVPRLAAAPPRRKRRECASDASDVRIGVRGAVHDDALPRPDACTERRARYERQGRRRRGRAQLSARRVEELGDGQHRAAPTVRDTPSHPHRGVRLEQREAARLRERTVRHVWGRQDKREEEVGGRDELHPVRKTSPVV